MRRWETISIFVGYCAWTDTYGTGDYEKVEFEGKQLAKLVIPGEGTDSHTETLYKTTDGQLLVHVEDLTSISGAHGAELALHEVSEADLQTGGRFQDLGREAGYVR